MTQGRYYHLPRLVVQCANVCSALPSVLPDARFCRSNYFRHISFESATQLTFAYHLTHPAWPAPSDPVAPAADGWSGGRADRSPPPHERDRQRDRSRSPGRNGDDRGRSNASGGGGGGANPGNNLHVSGLSSRVDNRMLEETFGKFGKVAKAAVVYDPHSRESRGFAFVTMEGVEEAEAAIAGLHNTELAGKPLTVEKARRGRARTPTPGKYLGTARRDDRGYGGGGGGYREDRYAAERPYYPREYDSRYSGRDRYEDRRYDDRREDRYRGGYEDRRRYDDPRGRYEDGRGGGRYDDGRGGRYDEARAGGRYEERRYEERR